MTGHGDLAQAWSDALTTLVPTNPKSSAVWIAAPHEAVALSVALALRARLSHTRRRRVDLVRSLRRGVALLTPPPASDRQWADMVIHFNDGARAASRPDRIGYTRLVGCSRSATGFVRDCLRASLGCQPASPSTARDQDPLRSLLHAARTLRVRLWIVDRAERAEPDLLQLFDAWLAQSSDDAALLLELRRGGERWVVTNLPPPH